MEDIITKAEVLIEAIPYFQKFSQKIFVVKMGGKVVSQNLEKNIQDIILLSLVGIKVLIVHGGGDEITSMAEKLGIKSKFKEGIRQTDDEMMEIVEMVLEGKIRGKIVSEILKMGGKALGISGRDLGIITAERIEGRVGKVKYVNPKISQLLNDNILVLSSICADENDFSSLNVNADEVAVETAVALKAEKLIFLIDEDGVKDKEGKIIPTLNSKKAEELIKDGTITGGMIPKIKNAIRAVKGGVKKVHIISGFIPHSILLEIFTKEGIGTEIID